LPAFYFLVLLGAIALWFLLAFAYKRVGRFFKRIFADSVNAMMTEDSKDTIFDTQEE